MKSVLLLCCFCILLCSCRDKSKTGESSNQENNAQLLEARTAIYTVAIGELKTRLQQGQSIKTPQLHAQNDSVKILSDSAKAYILFPYSVENQSGAVTKDIAAIDLIKKEGKWMPATANGVHITIAPSEYEEFDILAGPHLGKIGLIPEAIPAPTTSPSAVPTPIPLPR